MGADSAWGRNFAARVRYGSAIKDRPTGEIEIKQFSSIFSEASMVGAQGLEPWTR
jgi:hypothetical protein